MLLFNFKSSPPSHREAVGLWSFGALFQSFIPALSRRANIGGMLDQLGTSPLTPQSSLALVGLNGEASLLGIAPQNIGLSTKGNDPAAGAMEVE